MNIKAIFAAAAMVIAPQLAVANFYKITQDPLTINKCPLIVTNNAFDLALLNKGYFVVSHGKKDSELLFTRYGKLLITGQGYLSTNEGDYLLAINKKSDSKHLSKIKISGKNLPPKATSKAKIVMNFNANTDMDSPYETSMTLYDSLANRHVLKNRLVHSKANEWHSKIYVDEVMIGEGSLFFKTNGSLDKQIGFTHLQWPASYGMEHLQIDFSQSTQYAMPTSVDYTSQNGYSLGSLQGAEVDNNGDIIMLYSNGQAKALKNRIAVAMFTNPDYLHAVTPYLYRASDKSGPSRIHWKNGEYSVQAGVLEEVNCLS